MKSRQAEALGADGILVIPPLYATPTELIDRGETDRDVSALSIVRFTPPSPAGTGRDRRL